LAPATGTLSVDGRVLSRQKMEHTIPFLMSFDIGLDTRSPVDESYTLPFRFTGAIDKLTYNIRPEQLSARPTATSC
jgi:arylsulfatase